MFKTSIKNLDIQLQRVAAEALEAVADFHPHVVIIEEVEGFDDTELDEDNNLLEETPLQAFVEQLGDTNDGYAVERFKLMHSVWAKVMRTRPPDQNHLES